MIPRSSDPSGDVRPGHALRVPADEAVRGNEGRDALEERSVVRGRRSADEELRDGRPLEGDRRAQFLTVSAAGLRPQLKLTLLHERDADPGEVRDTVVQCRDDLAEDVVGGAAPVEDSLDGIERAAVGVRAHAFAPTWRSAPSNSRTRSMYDSGMAHALRSSRSTSTTVCEAVTMSTSSSR